ncbi:MAG TPA: hypothetical protein DCP28_15270 [Cytophagales bacterium]|nr:hypothetical protein [Cytophagales bacterium]
MKGGVSLNDDAGLEREADVMGERALSATTPVHAKTLKSASGIGNTHQAIQRRVGFEFQTNIALRNSQGDAPPLKTALFEATGWKIECDQGDLEFITDPFSNYGPLHQTMLNLVAWAHGMAQLPYVIPVEKQEQADQFDHPDDQHIREGILLDNQTRNLALMDANQGQLIANYFALGPASALTAAPQTTVGIPMEKIISSLHLVAAKEYTLGTGMGQKQVKLGAAQEREPTLVSAHDATVVLVNHLRQTHPDIPEMAWRKLEGIIGLAASYIRTANVPGRSSYSYVKVMAPMMSRVNFTALFNALPESVKPFLTPANVALAADLQANSRVFGVKGAIKDKAGPTIEEWVTSMTSGFDLLSRIGDFFSVEGIMEGSESMGEFDALDEADEKYDMPLVPIEFREMTKSVPYPLWPELTENIMIFANALIKAEFF